MKLNRQQLIIVIFLIVIALGVSFPTAFLQTHPDGSQELRVTSDPDQIAGNVTGNITNFDRLKQRFGSK